MNCLVMGKVPIDGDAAMADWLAAWPGKDEF
jgi:hypothetical protein